MPININITDSEEEVVPQEPEGVKIEVVEKDKIEGKLKLRSAMNGDLMILDHTDIDIVVPGNNKGRRSLALIYWLMAREILRIKGELPVDGELEETIDDFEAPLI